MFGNFRRFGSVWFGYRFYTQPFNKELSIDNYFFFNFSYFMFVFFFSYITTWLWVNCPAYFSGYHHDDNCKQSYIIHSIQTEKKTVE